VSMLWLVAVPRVLKALQAMPTHASTWNTFSVTVLSAQCSVRSLVPSTLEMWVSIREFGGYSRGSCLAGLGEGWDWVLAGGDLAAGVLAGDGEGLEAGAGDGEGVALGAGLVTLGAGVLTLGAGAVTLGAGEGLAAGDGEGDALALGVGDATFGVGDAAFGLGRSSGASTILTGRLRAAWLYSFWFRNTLGTFSPCFISACMSFMPAASDRTTSYCGAAGGGVG
jgi:hypothetical protein